jgi:toxin ParE1/3/4
VRIRWTPTAARHVAAIGEYIAAENPHAAAEIVRAIRRAAERLARYPTIGRSGRVAGTRELVVATTPYIVVYRVGLDTVDVLAIIHAARDWPKSF